MTNLSKSLWLFVATLFILTACSSASKKSKQTSNRNDSNSVKGSTLLAADEFESKLASMPNAQLIDVRTPKEFNDGYIKGAININYQGDSFTEDIEKLDKTRPTFVYCRSGGRSAESCNYMANHGFKELYELDNGISSWLNKNKPVEKKTE